MCRAVTCDVCGGTTWAGCGQHVAQVKKSVPTSQWCNGRHSDAEIAAVKAQKRGFFSRLLGK